MLRISHILKKIFSGIVDNITLIDLKLGFLKEEHTFQLSTNMKYSIILEAINLLYPLILIKIVLFKQNSKKLFKMKIPFHKTAIANSLNDIFTESLKMVGLLLVQL